MIILKLNTRFQALIEFDRGLYVVNTLPDELEMLA